MLEGGNISLNLFGNSYVPWLQTLGWFVVKFDEMNFAFVKMLYHIHSYSFSRVLELYIKMDGYNFMDNTRLN